MKILMIGDIIGRPGREIVTNCLKQLKLTHQIDFIVANVENAAAGFGLLPAMGEELLVAGVDVMTSGNHIFDKREVINYIKEQPRLLRPANYAETVPGEGLWLGHTKNDIALAVINVQGRTFMPPTDCPFRTMDKLLSKVAGKTRVILVDHHAEATSEKVAMGWYLDGRCSAVVGTHTHVPTADERVLPRGTAYITDLGMTGPYDSVIGIDKETVLERFLSGLPKRFEPAQDDVRLSGVIIDVNEQTGQARSITRLQVYPG